MMQVKRRGTSGPAKEGRRHAKHLQKEEAKMKEALFIPTSTNPILLSFHQLQHYNHI